MSHVHVKINFSFGIDSWNRCLSVHKRLQIRALIIRKSDQTGNRIKVVLAPPQFSPQADRTGGNLHQTFSPDSVSQRIYKQKKEVFLRRKKNFLILPSPAVMSLTKLSQGGNNLYMSLVSDIPAVDGNIKKSFFTVNVFLAVLP